MFQTIKKIIIPIASVFFTEITIKTSKIDIDFNKSNPFTYAHINILEMNNKLYSKFTYGFIEK